MRIFKMTGWLLLLAPVALVGIAGAVRLITLPADGAAASRPALPRLAPGSLRVATYRCAIPSQCFAGVAAFTPSQAITVRKARTPLAD